MSEEVATAITAFLNVTTFVLYLVLLVVILSTLLYRWSLFRKAKERIPLLLKRDVVLFAALAWVFGEILVIRMLGITVFTDPGIPRIAFIVQQNILILGALAYWAKVELTDF